MTLEFELPEEREDANIHYNAIKYYQTVTDLDNWARGKIKYGNLSEKENELLEEVRRFIRESD